MPSDKLWRASLGERGLRVYLFERTPGGNVYREVYIGGKRVAPKKSLRHRDKERAEADGYTLLAKLKTREEALTGGKLTLSALFDMYRVSSAHGMKKASTQRGDEAMLRKVMAFLGEEREVLTLSHCEVERYEIARRNGGHGSRPVGPRAVAKDLVALRTVLNWATRQRYSRGGQLLDHNPLLGMKLPAEKNPCRPVETYDRYLRLMDVAHDVDWRLPAALVLAESTGQRIGSTLRLRKCDVDLDRPPYGRVQFRGEHQKTGYEHSVALTTGAAEVLRRHMARLVSGPEAWLFPAERDPEKAVCVSVMSRLLREAYIRSGLETSPGGLWHPWRRKWATERKGMPLKDVAAAGGWRDPTTLLRCYQQPDECTMLRVVLEAPKLYGEGANMGEVTPKPTPLRVVK
jgi:integrase